MPYIPSPIQRDSVISRAAEEICRLIEGKKLLPGDRLPPETHLSEMLGISRNSVREALRVLHGLGFVEKLPGKGVVVRAAAVGGGKVVSDKKAQREAAPLAHEVRMLIERFCAELSAERISAAELAELEGYLEALDQAAHRKDFEKALEAHEAFHSAVLAASRNAPLIALYNQARTINTSDMSADIRKTLGDPLHRKQHHAILAALRDHDAARAAAAVQTHLQTVMPIVEFVAKHSRTVPSARTRTSAKAKG
jgi:DNA-binding FadR family transcriptional regulator